MKVMILLPPAGNANRSAALGDGTSPPHSLAAAELGEVANGSFGSLARKGEYMRYTTVQFHNLKARLILDIYQVSISVWKWRTRRFAWQLFFESLRWWQIGPVEWMIHPVSRAAELPLERSGGDGVCWTCPNCGEKNNVEMPACTKCYYTPS